LAGNAFLGQLDFPCREAIFDWAGLANTSASEFAVTDSASLKSGADQAEHF
jgi:hypothetical protein